MEEITLRKYLKETASTTKETKRDWEDGTARISGSADLVAAGSNRELTRDGREYALDLVAQGDQNGDGDHGNEGENQGVLHESLALLALHPAQRAFGAKNYFVDHCLFTSLPKKLFEIP